jgi:hypothetical protein
MIQYPTDFLSSDLLALSTFAKRMDTIIDGSSNFQKADSWGHPDLPRYLPWMGSRYGFMGCDIPLSVFRGEGVALFLLARLTQPVLIAECFTGTGYAAAWLAAGCPQAVVYTIDDYREGELREEGFSKARQLFCELGLSNIVSLYGVVDELQSSLAGRKIDLLLVDGPYGETPSLSEGAIVVRHDDMNGQDIKRSFSLLGGSNMSVMCSTVEERETLMAVMSTVFPVRRCDA